jgi:hypothetical protein
MTRKSITALTLVLMFLVFTLTEALTTQGVFAQAGPVMNPGPDYSPLSVTVTSPAKNHVYDSVVDLTFTVTKPSSWFTSGAILYNYGCQGEVTFIFYSIDGAPSVKLPANDTKHGAYEHPIPDTLSYTLPLVGLSEGLHTISVSAEGVYNYWTDVYTNNVVVGNASQKTFFVKEPAHVWGGSVSPPADAKTPRITILSPQEPVITSNNLSLSFQAHNSVDSPLLTDVWYQITYPNSSIISNHLGASPSTRSLKENLIALTDGNYTLTVFANGAGGYLIDGTYYYYEMANSSSVGFVIDSVPPTISFDSYQNTTYSSADVALNFTTNKPIQKILYSLDNQANVTATPNTPLILQGLSNGAHIITVYAEDEYGLMSVPATENCIVDVNVFPTLAVVTLATAIAVAAVFVLLFYRRNRKSS